MMPEMRPILSALAAVCALLAAGGAAATSFGPRTKHDPKLGCMAVKQVVAGLNAGRLADPDDRGAGPTFFSDAFGEVEAREEPAFLHAMRHSEGKPDDKPIELRDVAILHEDEEDPTYLVALDREAWHLTRDVQDEMLEAETIDDPHFSTDTSYWLVSFISNEITDFRQADEMFRLMKDARELKDCY
jgi:hypothetical protein